jgi:hypothetical protein
MSQMRVYVPSFRGWTEYNRATVGYLTIVNAATAAKRKLDRHDLTVAGGRYRFDQTWLIMKATDTITLVEGYDAMRIFLEIIKRRYGDAAGGIEFVIAGLKWADGSPVDPTMWEDWLAAVQIACSRRDEDEIVQGQ